MSWSVLIHVVAADYFAGRYFEADHAGSPNNHHFRARTRSLTRRAKLSRHACVRKLSRYFDAMKSGARPVAVFLSVAQ
jgi:hypothetical protein